MPSEPVNIEEEDLRKLRAELGEARRQLHQREEALAALNRRLLLLERNQSGIDQTLGPQVAGAAGGMAGLSAENSALREEIERIYATKLFRVARPARRIYGLLRSR